MYKEINKVNESVLLKEIIMALTKELIVFILAKEDLDEQLSEQNKFLYSASKLNSVFNIIDYIPYSWLTLLSEIMNSNAFRDYSEETPIENILQRMEDFPIENFFSQYSLSEKVSCITFLISCFYDTKIFHETLSERIENQEEFSREKTLIKAQIKELEQQQALDIKSSTLTRASSSNPDKISKLQAKLSDLSTKIDNIQVRIPPLGLDRHYNEYYIFKFDLTRLYMLKPLENTWHYFSTKSDLYNLLQSLCPRGLRESKLLESLRQKLPILCFLSDSDSDSAEAPPPDYSNRLSAFKEAEGDLPTAKKLLLDLERRFSKFLHRSHKQWETADCQDRWRDLVQAAEEVPSLAELLMEHYQKSSTPLRMAVVDPNSEDSEEKECERKYRKVSIRIWQDFGEQNTMWEGLVGTVNNAQQLVLAIGMYESVLENYMQKKQERMRHEERKGPREEKKKKKEFLRGQNGSKHEDNCFFCEDGGELICCEGCTRVVHPECIGLNEVPEEDWYCDSCNKQGFRVTRSRTRLMKLNS